MGSFPFLFFERDLKIHIFIEKMLFILQDIQFNSIIIISITHSLGIIESALVFLFLWNKYECSGINLGCD